MARNVLMEAMFSNPQTDSGMRWATVSSVSPLMIRFDGTSQSAPVSSTLAGALRAGERVLYMYDAAARVYIVLGRAEDPVPPPPAEPEWPKYPTGSDVKSAGAGLLPVYNSWTHYSAFGNLQLLRLPSGAMILDGSVRGGKAAHITNIPAQFRPASERIITGMGSNGAQRIDISSAGAVSVNGTLPYWVSIPGYIWFPGV